MIMVGVGRLRLITAGAGYVRLLEGKSAEGVSVMNTENWEAWSFRAMAGEAGLQAENLVGFEVEATDGGIGKIVNGSTDEGSSWIVVDTGPWIFGRQVVLPAGTIDRVDVDNEKVYLDLTKDQVKDSPPPTEETATPDHEYRGILGTYYGGIYGPRGRGI